MATRNIVPRANGEGGIGTATKKWKYGYYEQIKDLEVLNFNTASELTISSGVVTKTQLNHTIDTEGDAASDDLDTINGGSGDEILFIRAIHTDRTVVIKHGTGNILTTDGEDYSLDSSDKIVLLMYDGTNWRMIGSSSGGSSSGNPRRIINPANLRLDSSDTGSEKDTIFDVIDTISFNNSTDGSIWSTVEFNDTDFDINSDATVNLIVVYDGTVTSDKVVRLTISAWVADINEAPVLASPTVTQTTDLTVSTTTDNVIRMLSSFLTIGSANFNTNTQTISLKIKREATHANDTYGGSFHVIKVIVKQ